MAFESEEDCAQFLDRKAPEELVEIFSEADPLRLVERCGRFVWEQGLFLDVDRIVELAVYHIAVRARRRPRGESVEGWLQECIANVVRGALRKDLEMVRKAGEGEIEAWAPAHVFIRDAFGITDFKALQVCSSFNCLSRRERQAFFALCMDKLSVEECLEAGFAPPDWLREATLCGLDRLLDIQPHPLLAGCSGADEE